MLAAHRYSRALTCVWLIALSTIGPLATGAAAATHGPMIDDLTWVELRDAVRNGKTTVLIPVGGTEQSGAHLALGKHNVRVQVLARRIALQLDNALVAPVVAYVPEGQVSPPTQHMRYPGTISIPDSAFSAVIEGAARSLRQHGFKDIVLIGDHGGYQRLLEASAGRLNREWAGSAARAHYIGAYYEAAQGPYAQRLREQGLTEAQIGLHAGAADTALTLATSADRVRQDEQTQPRDAAALKALGVVGDPRPATAALGQIGVDLIVGRSVAAIQESVARRRARSP